MKLTGGVKLLAKTWEIDVEDELKPMYLDYRYSRLDLLLLRRNKPLAILPVYPENGQRTIWPAQLREQVASHALRESRSPAASEETADLPAISVVVCTRDRPLSLENCLRSLKKLDYPNYEVIVVDNKSASPEVHAVVMRSGFRYVREERAGLDWARNRGVREAVHEIVAYIDDDAYASPGWLRGIAAGFGDPLVSVVTGLVLPAEIETEAQSLFEQYGGMAKGFDKRIVRPERRDAPGLLGVHAYGLGANMAYKRQVLLDSGGFDTALDVGTPSFGAGDLDMLHRALASGCVLAYEPSAWVRHRHRRDYEGLKRQIYSNGRSFGVYLIKVWRERSVPRPEVAKYAAGWISGWLLARIFRRLARKESFPLALSWAELKGAFTAPYAFMATYRHDRRVRAQAI